MQSIQSFPNVDFFCCGRQVWGASFFISYQEAYELQSLSTLHSIELLRLPGVLTRVKIQSSKGVSLFRVNDGILDTTASASKRTAEKPSPIIASYLYVWVSLVVEYRCNSYYSLKEVDMKSNRTAVGTMLGCLQSCLLSDFASLASFKFN